jgi:hypothetical protein
MVNEELLTSKQEVADLLGMSITTLGRYLRKYKFTGGTTNGRWRVFKTDVFAWWKHVQHQEHRHPEARRMRPEEAPELQEIKAR